MHARTAEDFRAFQHVPSFQYRMLLGQHLFNGSQSNWPAHGYGNFLLYIIDERLLIYIGYTRKAMKCNLSRRVHVLDLHCWIFVRFFLRWAVHHRRTIATNCLDLCFCSHIAIKNSHLMITFIDVGFPRLRLKWSHLLMQVFLDYRLKM